MSLIYKPFGIVLGILAGLLGKKLFDFVWTKIDDEEPPKATTRDQLGRRAGRGRGAGDDLPGHARRGRPLRRDRLALPDGQLAGREAARTPEG